MGLIAIFKFTLGPKEGANKWKHPFYRIAGSIVVISLVFMALYIFLKWEEKLGVKDGVF